MKIRHRNTENNLPTCQKSTEGTDIETFSKTVQQVYLDQLLFILFCIVNIRLKNKILHYQKFSISKLKNIIQAREKKNCVFLGNLIIFFFISMHFAFRIHVGPVVFCYVLNASAYPSGVFFNIISLFIQKRGAGFRYFSASNIFRLALFLSKKKVIFSNKKMLFQHKIKISSI